MRMCHAPLLARTLTRPNPHLDVTLTLTLIRTQTLTLTQSLTYHNRNPNLTLLNLRLFCRLTPARFYVMLAAGKPSPLRVGFGQVIDKEEGDPYSALHAHLAQTVIAVLEAHKIDLKLPVHLCEASYPMSFLRVSSA